MAVLILALKPAHASVVTVPQGLNPGDWYQLVFVTSDTTQAKNTEIDYYNNWVNGLANASESLVKDLDTEWRAIASTESIDAMENTHTNPIWDISCPIYNLAGELVASSYSDLWDGDINASINIDEIGTPISIEVWTGTSSDVLTFFRCCGYLSTAGTRRPGPLASVNQPRGHLDLLTDAFMIRQLQPYHADLRKRQVKSPGIYVRDTGLLNRLLGIDSMKT